MRAWFRWRMSLRMRDAQRDIHMTAGGARQWATTVTEKERTMIDLEQEFQLLMRMTLQTINNKVVTGELTRPEANQLITMVNVRMQPASPVAGDDFPPTEGWSASTEACYGSYRDEEEEA